MFIMFFFYFCSQRGSDEMVTSPGVEGGPVTNGDTMGTNHVDNNNDAKKVSRCRNFRPAVIRDYINLYTMLRINIIDQHNIV